MCYLTDPPFRLLATACTRVPRSTTGVSSVSFIGKWKHHSHTRRRSTARRRVGIAIPLTSARAKLGEVGFRTIVADMMRQCRQPGNANLVRITLWQCNGSVAS